MKNALISTYAAGAIAVLLLSEPLLGQEPRAAAQRPSVPELLADFEVKAQEPDYRGGAFDLHRFIWEMTFYSERWPAATVDSLLRGLEELAIASSEQRVRQYAISWIGEAGNATRSNPQPGTVARLSRIYDRSGAAGLERWLISHVRTQAEREAAIALLKRIAEEPGARGAYHTPASVAINALTHMDEDGRTALRQLHTRGHVRDPSARHFLERLAANDFRLPQR